MKTLELKQMEALEGGRPFIGSVTTCQNTSVFNPETGGTTTACIVSTTNYFFWINVGTGGDQDGVKYGSCSDNGY